MDVNRRVIGFGGRVMGDGKPKYLNSPETIVFDKSRNLFGINYLHGKLKDGVILIAGGDGKSQDFTDLAKHFDGCVKALILLGRDAPVIEEAAKRTGFTDIYNCKDMPECVRKAAEIAGTGDKVLLSPACASWDMYDNFEQRGRHFKQCVKEMLK